MPLQHQIYLIRHGEVAVSPNICYGQLDCDVTNAFEADLIKLTHFVLSKKITSDPVIITSPLMRCFKLGDGLKKRLKEPAELHVNTHFQEIYFGQWEGLTWEEIGKDNVDAWSSDLLDFTFPGGESARQFDCRVIKAWQILNQELRLLTTEKTIFMILHAGVIRSILSHFLHMPLAHTLTLQIDKMQASHLKVVPSECALSRCVGINYSL